MKKYTKNPITEALIDIKIDPILSSDSSEIEKIYEILKDDFPEKKPCYTVEAVLQLKKSVPENMKENISIDGFQFWKRDKTEVAQCRLDGFSYSRLKPYDCWESHSPNIYTTWNKYLKKFRPDRVKRIAVRFINVFEIPKTTFELEEYFNATPKPPQNFLQNAGSFLQKLEIGGDKEMTAVVTFTNSRPTKPNLIPILLDIDVYQTLSCPPEDKAITETIEELHIFAEKIFEGYISEKTRDLIA